MIREDFLLNTPSDPPARPTPEPGAPLAAWHSGVARVSRLSCAARQQLRSSKNCKIERKTPAQVLTNLLLPVYILGMLAWSDTSPR